MEGDGAGAPLRAHGVWIVSAADQVAAAIRLEGHLSTGHESILTAMVAICWLSAAFQPQT